MTKHLRLGLLGTVAILATAFSNTAFAALYTATGTPILLSAFSSNGNTSNNDDDFEIAGFKSAGACATDSATGDVILAMHRETTTDIDANRIFAIALAAEELGKTVTVTVNTLYTDGQGACYISYISM